MNIRNVCLASGSMADILVEGPKIKGVFRAGTLSGGIDAIGLVALPGIIDPHVHFRAPGVCHKEGWQTGSAAALKGGVTTVFDMPNTSPPLTTFDRLVEKRKIVKADAKVNAYFWFGATADNLKEIEAVSREPDIIGVKIYMGSTTGDLLVTSEQDLHRIFSVCAKNNLVVGVHAEDEMLMRERRRLFDRDPKISEHNLVRSAEVEVAAVRKALRLAVETKCRLYLCHLSTPESIRAALIVKENFPVFIEAAPHHFTLDDRCLSRPDGGFFKVNPPLRAKEDVKYLRRKICYGGIDVVGSDHAPHLLYEKINTKYDDVPSGMPGVETSLSILLSFVAKGKMPFARVAELTSGNAARIFGFKSKGIIAKGYDADITLIDPRNNVTFKNSDVKAKCGWTPYNEMTFWGVPRITIVGGKILFSV